MEAIQASLTTQKPSVTGLRQNDSTMAVARELEASFLAEMLKSAGVGEARKAFGGGAGEDQFSSFLVQEYAKATVEAGGIGLAETIYKSLVRAKDLAT